MIDRFGNKWTFDSNNHQWFDQYKNSIGFSPDDVGSPSNPLLCSKDGQLWQHNGQIWISNNNEEQTNYPGTEKPKSTRKKIPREPPFTCVDEKYIRIAMKRLERKSNRPGFGNARAVRTFFDSVKERQARRIMHENKRGKNVDDFLFTKEDILGVSINKSQLRKCKPYLKLQKMEGLKPVKEKIDLLIDLVISNVKREMDEKPILDVILNQVFLGNPGTGKK